MAPAMSQARRRPLERLLQPALKASISKNHLMTFQALGTQKTLRPIQLAPNLSSHDPELRPSRMTTSALLRDPNLALDQDSSESVLEMAQRPYDHKDYATDDIMEYG